MTAIFPLLSLLIISTIAFLSILKNRSYFPVAIARYSLICLSVYSLGFLFNSPVLAKTDVLTEPQLQENVPFEEQIQISPLGTSCSGICVEKEVKQVDPRLTRSDREIKKEIQSLLRREDRVSIRVDNGAVFLSGAVKDRSVAANLVQQVEAIPGVHWISVNFNCPENQR